MKEFPGGVAVALKLALSVTPRHARSDFDRDFVLHSWGPRCATSRMAEAACAHPVRIEVIVDPVFAVWANSAGDVVQAKRCPRPPGDVVVGAGAIAADAKGADNAGCVIQGFCDGANALKPDGLTRSLARLGRPGGA